MVRDRTLRWARWRGPYEIREGYVRRRSTKGTCTESFQILCDAPLAWLSEKEPRLEAGTGNNRHLAVFLVTKFRAVPATQSPSKTDSLSTRFKTSHTECLSDEVGNQALRGKHHMCARN